jgi:hypothetical protein
MKLENSLSFEKNLALFSRDHPEIAEAAQIWDFTFQQGMMNQARIYLDRLICQSGMYPIWSSDH